MLDRRWKPSVEARRTDRSNEDRVLVLAPAGRDAALVAGLLRDAGVTAEVCPDAAALVAAMKAGAGAAVITEEALSNRNVDLIAGVLAEQPAWSDFPFVV